MVGGTVGEKEREMGRRGSKGYQWQTIFVPPSFATGTRGGSRVVRNSQETAQLSVLAGGF
jgi:hypothetical protein